MNAPTHAPDEHTISYSGRRILPAVLVSSVVVIASVSYVLVRQPGGDWEDGEMVLHDYEYDYAVSISNASGPYIVVVPIIVLSSGGPLPEIDFLEVVPAHCQMQRSDHGWGLRIGFHEAVVGSVGGSVDDLRESEMDERGYHHLSMIEPDLDGVDRWSDPLEIWMYSDAPGLEVRIEGRYDSHREWVNLLGQTTWTSGTGFLEQVENTTLEGWNLYELRVESLYIAS